MAATTTLEKVLGLVAAFVMERKGLWNHTEWEGFLNNVAALGIEPNDENKRSLGNLLEASKTFFREGECACKAAPQKKAAAKPKAKAKAK